MCILFPQVAHMILGLRRRSVTLFRSYTRGGLAL
jgi:hypothetical protein